MKESGTSLKAQIAAILVEALAHTHGNQQRAAQLLQISPRKLNYMMMKLKIPRPIDKVGR